MTGITTHVLDTSSGRPAAGIEAQLLRDGTLLALGVTDDDGRWTAKSSPAEPGTYQLVFATGAYFRGAAFHPQVSVDFTVRDASEHHHVPLLLSPFGYTTYRGS
jgi:5-hydroxyisourate hydrolase